MTKDSEESEDVGKKQLPKKRGRKVAKGKTDDSIIKDDLAEETNTDKQEEEETEKEETESSTKVKAPARKRGKKEIEDPVESVDATTDDDKEDEKSPSLPKKVKAPARKRGKKEVEDPVESADATTDDDKEDEKSPSLPKKAKKNTPKKRGQKTANGKDKGADSEEVKNTDDSEEVTENDDEEEPVSPSPKRKSKGRKADHPRTIDMVVEAIRTLNDSGGSSVQAIKAYILENYKVREDMIKHMMKTALTTALKQNLVARPKGKMEDEKLSKPLLHGRYRIHPLNNDEKDTKAAKFRERPASLRQFKISSTAKGKKKKKRKCH